MLDCCISFNLKQALVIYLCIADGFENDFSLNIPENENCNSEFLSQWQIGFSQWKQKVQVQEKGVLLCSDIWWLCSRYTPVFVPGCRSPEWVLRCGWWWVLIETIHQPAQFWLQLLVSLDNNFEDVKYQGLVWLGVCQFITPHLHLQLCIAFSLCIFCSYFEIQSNTCPCCSICLHFHQRKLDFDQNQGQHQR